MRKLIAYIGTILLLTGTAVAQTKTSGVDTIGWWVERLAAQKQAENLKSYYVDQQTARVCESWNSCAKWAFEQYTKDQTFKISKAQIITQRKVYRHRVAKETHLFVEAFYKHRTVYVEFTTPNPGPRTSSYHYIVKTSKK